MDRNVAEVIGVLESNLAAKTAELEKKLQEISKLEGDHAKYAEEAMRNLRTEKVDPIQDSSPPSLR